MKAKRLTSVAAALLVVAVAALPAGARGNRAAQVSVDYSMPAGLWLEADGSVLGAIGCIEAGGCLEFQIPEGATNVSVEIADSSGRPVFGLVSAAYSDTYGEVCGSTAEPIQIGPRDVGDDGAVSTEPDYLSVTIAIGLCEDGTPSLPTSGTVTATFS